MFERCYQDWNEGSLRQVERVYYPGLEGHPDHLVAKRLMKRFSGILSFELKGGKDSGITLVEVSGLHITIVTISSPPPFWSQSVRVVVLAVSLGGVESLIEHPASMTHCDKYVSPETKRASGITDGLVRLR